MVYTCILAPGAEFIVAHHAQEICVKGEDYMPDINSPTLRIQSLHRDDWRKYTAMINELTHQLSPNCADVTGSDFFDIVGQDEKNFTVFIVRDAIHTPEGKFIGMATVFFRQLLSGWIGEIHDVVVDDQYYRQGFGRLLTQHIFEYAKLKAKELGRPIKLSLTSKPAREAANAMYLKAGFKLVAEAGKYIKVTAVGNVNEYVEGATNLYTKTIQP